MPVTAFTHEGPPQGDEHREHPRRPLLAEDFELERRAGAMFRTAERGGLQWRRRSPNQRYVAHRRGNR